MQRLLIADTTQAFVTAIAKQLKDEYLIEVCDDGGRVLEVIRSFEPDILLIDMMLPALDGLSVIRAVRDSGITTKVIALTRSVEAYVMSSLEKMNVSYVFLKPCKAEAVISCIRDIGFLLRCPDMDGWCVENETESILLRLGFRIGPSRFRCVCAAVQFKHENPDSVITKEIYPAVARRCGGNADQVEKAIRDAVKDAWKKGDEQLWQMYFPPGGGGETRCPTNDEFIARIALCLIQRTRLKKPYKPLLKKVN